MIAADRSGPIPALDDKGAAMLSGMGVAHRLLLIYLLCFASVAYLAYTLVVEKNIAIEFARKELCGIGYVDVVRQSLASILRSRGAAALHSADRGGDQATLEGQIAALADAERDYGRRLHTAGLNESLRSEIHDLVTQGTGDPAARGVLAARAAKSAKMLISLIGDESNLILDPDLDSYYTMSVVMLRLPQAAIEATELADAARAVTLSRSAE